MLELKHIKIPPKDKNGKEISPGDLLVFDNGEDYLIFIGQDDKNFMHFYDTREIRNDGGLAFITVEWYEDMLFCKIVGNIINDNQLNQLFKTQARMIEKDSLVRVQNLEL